MPEIKEEMESLLYFVTHFIFFGRNDKKCVNFVYEMSKKIDNTFWY